MQVLDHATVDSHDALALGNGLVEGSNDSLRVLNFVWPGAHTSLAGSTWLG